ncbi:hypothetical protein Vretimale_16372 [Volvox reticuliferus]|uniref:Uncharacterized protein n=1 Tax=Volvox reticuliferus TaxID=1737510 RepID=A0A8J4LX73_9CHLO|nr:hypothetical protein Vretimale_16372 [Volvox reticuliferus]
MGAYETCRPHVARPRYYPTMVLVGMQHLVPQAAALAAAAVEVLTALQYSAIANQQSTAASNSIQQAKLYVRLSVMSVASMLQPVAKLAMQGVGLVAAVTTKQALPHLAQSPTLTPAPAAVSTPSVVPVQTQTPFPATGGGVYPSSDPDPSCGYAGNLKHVRVERRRPDRSLAAPTTATAYCCCCRRHGYSLAPTDTGPGSGGRGESREPRAPRRRRRDVAYERHLQGPQQPQPQVAQLPMHVPPSNQGTGRPGGERDRAKERGSEREPERYRRDGTIGRDRE